MGLVADVGTLILKEWERAIEAIDQITSDEARAAEVAKRKGSVDPRQPPTVSIPGWDDVIHIQPRYKPTNEEKDEYYAARRQHRAPNISDQAREAIERQRGRTDAWRRSAQDEYARAWGQLLTAFDNIQDLLSTIATFGQVSLWAGPRVLSLLGRVAPGAARVGVGLGARVGARFVPILGTVILVADVLNLLGLTGMLGSFVHSMLCSGPKGALSAGVPTALFKRGLKSEIWNAIRRNPVGRLARLDARSRAVGKLPGIGKLAEVFQTTDQMYGWGVSFGAVVGFLAELGPAALRLAEGGTVEIRSGWEKALGTDAWRQPFADKSPGELARMQTAARVMIHAPTVMATQDVFTTEEHLQALVAYAVAAPWLLAQLPRAWDDETVLAALDLEVEMVPELSPLTRALLEEDQLEVDDGARWPVPGAPRRIRVADLVAQLAPRIAERTMEFINRRRDTPEGVFAAAIVAQTTEALWHQLTGDVDALRFRLAPDMGLVAGLAEDGYLVSTGDPEPALWAFWQAARGAWSDKGDRYPGLDTIQRLAGRYSVTLVKMLPPDAPWPAEWTAGEWPATPEPIDLAELEHQLTADRELPPGLL